MLNSQVVNIKTGIEPEINELQLTLIVFYQNVPGSIGMDVVSRNALRGFENLQVY